MQELRTDLILYVLKIKWLYMSLFRRKKYWVALFAKLSVEIVSKLDNSIESQLDIMKAFISDHSEFQEYYEYTDNGYSDTNFDRPGFNCMMDDVRSVKINCICVKYMSRFVRGYLETGNHIKTTGKIEADLKSSYEAYKFDIVDKQTYLEQRQAYEKLEEKMQVKM